jgi:hypothetical protein
MDADGGKTGEYVEQRFGELTNGSCFGELMNASSCPVCHYESSNLENCHCNSSTQKPAIMYAEDDGWPTCRAP